MEEGLKCFRCKFDKFEVDIQDRELVFVCDRCKIAQTILPKNLELDQWPHLKNLTRMFDHHHPFKVGQKLSPGGEVKCPTCQKDDRLEMDRVNLATDFTIMVKLGCHDCETVWDEPLHTFGAEGQALVMKRAIRMAQFREDDREENWWDRILEFIWDLGESLREVITDIWDDIKPERGKVQWAEKNVRGDWEIKTLGDKMMDEVLGRDELVEFDDKPEPKIGTVKPPVRETDLEKKWRENESGKVESAVKSASEKLIRVNKQPKVIQTTLSEMFGHPVQNDMQVVSRISPQQFQEKVNRLQRQAGKFTRRMSSGIVQMSDEDVRRLDREFEEMEEEFEREMDKFEREMEELENDLEDSLDWE